MEINLLRIRELEVPVLANTVTIEEEKLRLLRDRFIKGEKMKPDELEILARSGTRAANDNCWGC